jgi:hypothetical protein
VNVSCSRALSPASGIVIVGESEVDGGRNWIARCWCECREAVNREGCWTRACSSLWESWESGCKRERGNGEEEKRRGIHFEFAVALMNTGSTSRKDMET